MNVFIYLFILSHNVVQDAMFNESVGFAII